MSPLHLTKLTLLMERASGSAELKIGLIDGPVATEHPDLTRETLREILGPNGSACKQAASMACQHGTFVAGILSAKRSSPAPGICPGCTLLMRSIFTESASGPDPTPSATPKELVAAIVDCIEAGARVINLSLALTQPSINGERGLEQALDLAVKRGVIVVAAAGNQGAMGGSPITRHPWVIPVVACDATGRPANATNLGASIGRRGLRAPGEAVTSLSAQGSPLTLGGTSVAAPFVTGAIALLWSEFPAASAAQIKLAVTQAAGPRRVSVVPPLLDAVAAFQVLAMASGRRHTA
jgi:subtilisin family serine protease